MRNEVERLSVGNVSTPSQRASQAHERERRAHYN